MSFSVVEFKAALRRKRKIRSNTQKFILSLLRLNLLRQAQDLITIPYQHTALPTTEYRSRRSRYSKDTGTSRCRCSGLPQDMWLLVFRHAMTSLAVKEELLERVTVEGSGGVYAGDMYRRTDLTFKPYRMVAPNIQSGLAETVARMISTQDIRNGSQARESAY
jgi:hypothetical protein